MRKLSNNTNATVYKIKRPNAKAQISIIIWILEITTYTNIYEIAAPVWIITGYYVFIGKTKQECKEIQIIIRIHSSHLTDWIRLNKIHLSPPDQGEWHQASCTECIRSGIHLFMYSCNHWKDLFEPELKYLPR